MVKVLLLVSVPLAAGDCHFDEARDRACRNRGADKGLKDSDPTVKVGVVQYRRMASCDMPSRRGAVIIIFITDDR
jgi:hypothetical protein